MKYICENTRQCGNFSCTHRKPHKHNSTFFGDCDTGCWRITTVTRATVPGSKCIEIINL